MTEEISVDAGLRKKPSGSSFCVTTNHRDGVPYEMTICGWKATKKEWERLLYEIQVSIQQIEKERT